MENKSVVITEKDGKFEIQNNGLSDFALLGILECIVFEMKTAKIMRAPAQNSEVKDEPVAKIEAKKVENPAASGAEDLPAPPVAAASSANAPDIRKRIVNAVKAITDLGGQVPSFDLDKATDKELHEELSILTEQYKRLKSTKTVKK